MDYEKAYKEALERAKHYTKYSTNRSDTAEPIKNAVEMIFPELKESEDKIFKELLHNLITSNDYTPSSKEIFSIYGKTKEDCLAWLEKQREQKSIEQDTETQDLWVYIREWNDKFGRLPKDEDELAACIDYVMKRQKPAEWSEDDEMFLFNIIKDLERLEKESKIEQLKDVYSKEINWLKLRKPQKHWKPTEEQLNEVKNAIRVTGTNGIVLLSLYNDIKKL